MKRRYRVASKPDHRICNRCNQELPATPSHFISDRSRRLGISYECRECHRRIRLGKDRRRLRWSNMTDDQRRAAKVRNQRYAKTLNGRACFLRKSYQRVDACDLSTDEVAAIIAKPCHYCETLTAPRGLDRIDNSLAHVRGNVLPACAACNFARGDRLTVEEMKRVGAVIADIMNSR